MSDLFNGTNDQGATNPEVNYLESLVGEGKKFKTVDDLARGKAESDAYIANLKTQLETLESELATRKRLEDVLDKLGQTKSDPQDTNSQTNHNGDGNGGTPTQTPDIEKLVEQALSKKETENRQRQNLDEVKRTLTEAWGDSFATKLLDAGKELGMSREELNALAANNPKALYRLVGAQPQARQPDLFTPPTSAVNTSGFAPVVNSNTRNKSHYDKIRRDEPSRYWSNSVQNQMHKDALALGEKFFT